MQRETLSVASLNKELKRLAAISRKKGTPLCLDTSKPLYAYLPDADACAQQRFGVTKRTEFPK